MPLKHGEYAKKNSIKLTRISEAYYRTGGHDHQSMTVGEDGARQDPVFPDIKSRKGGGGGGSTIHSESLRSKLQTGAKLEHRRKTLKK